VSPPRTGRGTTPHDCVISFEYYRQVVRDRRALFQKPNGAAPFFCCGATFFHTDGRGRAFQAAAFSSDRGKMPGGKVSALPEGTQSGCPAGGAALRESSNRSHWGCDVFLALPTMSSRASKDDRMEPASTCADAQRRTRRLSIRRARPSQAAARTTNSLSPVEGSPRSPTRRTLK
jgi:hypothetical protein